MEKIRNFKDLQIWQKGILIVKRVYELTREFPQNELYGLVSQMRRSAISIPSNIAEGFKRLHGKEFKQFLHIALGSAAELETQLIISAELGLVRNHVMKELLTEDLDHLSKMISSLLKKL
jgi:four helix bundle protein